jgi:hypothetical protein
VHPKAGARSDNWLLIKAADDAARTRNKRDILDGLFAQRPRLDRGRRLFDPGAAGGGVAMPLDWGEFDAIGSADHFTLANASRRLNGLGCDPWQAIDTIKQRLRAKRSRAPRRSV